MLRPLKKEREGERESAKQNKYSRWGVLAIPQQMAKSRPCCMFINLFLLLFLLLLFFVSYLCFTCNLFAQSVGFSSAQFVKKENLYKQSRGTTTKGNKLGGEMGELAAEMRELLAVAFFLLPSLSSTISIWQLLNLRNEDYFKI